MSFISDRLFLERDSGLCLCGDIFGGESVCLEKRGNLAGSAVNVLNTDAENGNGAGFCESFAYCAAETAYDIMFFRSNDCTRLGSRFCEKLGVDGLDGVDVDDFSGNAFFCEKFFCFERDVNHQTGCNDGDVGAFCEGDTLAELELVVSSFVKISLQLLFPKPDLPLPA